MYDTYNLIVDYWTTSFKVRCVHSNANGILIAVKCQIKFTFALVDAVVEIRLLIMIGIIIMILILLRLIIIFASICKNSRSTWKEAKVAMWLHCVSTVVQNRDLLRV